MSEQYVPTPSTVPFSGLVQFDHAGETVRWYNGTGVEVPAGAPVIQGDLFGVPTRPIAAGAWGSLNIEGAMVFPRRANDPGLSAGKDAYWDNTNLVATSLAAGNTYVGKVECGQAVDGTIAVADTWVYIQVEAAANGSTNGFAAVTATGTVVSNAASVTINALNVVTGATGTSGGGVVLPTLPSSAYTTGANVRLEIKNNSGTNTLPVYPDAGSGINALGTGTRIVLAALASCVFVCGGPNQWYTVPTVPA